MKLRADAPRMRSRDRWMAVGGALFLVASLAIVAFGSGDDRLAGAAVLLFSVAILMLPLSGRLAARSGVAPRLDRVEGAPALVIPGSPVKLRMMRLACLCFGAAGLVMAVWPRTLASTSHSPGEIQVVGIVCAAFFGGVGLIGLLLQRGPFRLDLLPDRLEWRLGGGRCSVPWDAITEVGLRSIRGTWFLALGAEPGALRVPPAQRWLYALNRGLLHADASVALEAFPVEPERLADAIALCAEAPERRAELGTPHSLAWLADDPYDRQPGSSPGFTPSPG